MVPAAPASGGYPRTRSPRCLEELRERAIRYEAARQVLPQRLAHHVLLRDGAQRRLTGRPGAGLGRPVGGGAGVRGAGVAEARPAAGAVRPALVGRDVLAEHAGGLLTPAEQELLLWPAPPRSKGAAKWSAADLVLLDELADLLERTPSLGHVVLDEAQDLSPMQLRAVGRRCSTGSATVLGDIAQGTTPWATDSWASSLAHLGKPDAPLEVLDRGFRVPASVIDFAARLLPSMAPGLGAPVSVRENPGRLDLVRVPAAGVAGRWWRLSARVAEEPGSVGVIAPASLVAAVSAS